MDYAANHTSNNRLTDFPSFSSSPSTPLQLCGSLTGNTVRVQGDTGDLQFSVQFNIHKKEHISPDDTFTTFPGVQNVRNSDSAYLTPPCARHDQIQNGFAQAEEENEGISRIEVDTSDTFQNINIPEVEDTCALAPYSSTPTCDQQNHLQEEETPYAEKEISTADEVVMTRLRSGVLTPVKYYPEGRHTMSTGTLQLRKRTTLRGKNGNPFEKMLKRRSLPVRPANAYAFFVIANWGTIKHAATSFTVTSKKLSKKWSRLSKDEKKEYEDMASKDNARYMRQCILLKNDEAEEEATSE